MLLEECPKFHVRFVLLVVLLGFSLTIISCSSQTLENHISRGEELLSKRKFEEAAMEFRSAVDIDNNSAEAHWGLARSYENLGKFLETVEELHRVTNLQPQNLDAKAKLGNYFLLFNPPQRDETKRILQEIFAQDANFIEGHILKASLFASEGKPENEILDVLNYAISLNEKRTESYISLSRYFMKAEKFDEAEKTLQRAITANPNDALGYVEYGRFLTYDERFEDAEKQFLKGIEVEPKDIEAREAIAKFYTARDQLDKAEQAYLELVKIEENSPESRMQLGDFYAFADRDEDAIKTFFGILADNSGYVRARYRLGEIYLDRKEPEKAAEQAEELLSVNDGDAEAIMLRARIMLQEGKADEAVKDLEEVLKKNPSQKDALFYITQAKLALGQVNQARAFIGDLEKYYPNFQRTKILKIQASFSSGEIERALQQSNELLRDIDKIYENNGGDSAEKLADLKISALTARGLANLQFGNTADARTDLERVASLSPGSSSAMVNLAKVFVAENNLSEALNLYQKALAADNKNFDALTGAVNIQIQQNKFAEAHALLDQLIQKDGQKKDYLAALHYLKSDVYKGEGNFAATEGELKKALEVDDTYLPAYSAYAALLIGRNQINQAIEQYKKSVEKKPSASVYTLIGILEDARQNLSEAEKNYRKALELDPETPIAANNLAWLIAANDRGSLDEALRLSQATVENNPNIAGYYDTLGWVYYKKGLYSPAIEQLKKAVALDNAEATRNGEKPNAEYRQRLAKVLASSS
jgi:tetratricopeptide (TPR) repeat protein